MLCPSKLTVIIGALEGVCLCKDLAFYGLKFYVLHLYYLVNLKEKIFLFLCRNKTFIKIQKDQHTDSQKQNTNKQSLKKCCFPQ